MNYLRLAISLALPQLAGILGSIFTVRSIPEWYANLNKPSFTPPNWLFGPAWITLYALMGISSYLIWQKSDTDPEAKKALWVFWVHLFFNAIWSPIFFGLRNPGLAMAVIVLIWLFIVYLIYKFWGINKWAAALLIPYLLWVSYASALNFSIWRMN
jgi:translocator protein